MAFIAIVRAMVRYFLFVAVFFLSCTCSSPSSAQCIYGPECLPVARELFQLGDIDLGFDALNVGCEMGMYDSCFELLGAAGEYDYRPVINGWKMMELRVLRLSDAACKSGDLYGCVVFAQMVRDSIGFWGYRKTYDWRSYENIAFNGLVRSCAGDMLSACYWLAYSLAIGWGCGIAFDDAVMIWTMSCDSENSMSCAMLSNVSRCRDDGLVHKLVT